MQFTNGVNLWEYNLVMHSCTIKKAYQQYFMEIYINVGIAMPKTRN